MRVDGQPRDGLAGRAAAARAPRRGPRRRCRGGPRGPVSWVYSPGVMSAWVSPFHLTSFSSTTLRAGMLIPSARVSVAKTALTRPRAKSSSTTSLKVGSSPAWCAARPRSRPSTPLPVAQHGQVLVGDVARVRSSTIRADLVALLGVGVSRTPAVQALLDGGVAAGAAEDEGDGGQQAGSGRAGRSTSARLGVRPAARTAAGARARARARPRSRRASSSRASRSSSGLTWLARLGLPSRLPIGRPRRTGRTAGCPP